MFAERRGAATRRHWSRHHVRVDSQRVRALRDLLERTGWVERTRDFARPLHRVAEPGRLLLVGTPEDEPWHLAAHLDDESRLAGLPQLSPTLIRWSPPAGAPAHLSVTLSRLEAASRNETVFVVAPTNAPDPLLERVSDARRIGATILSIDGGDDELGDLVHERLVVPSTEALRNASGGLDVMLDIDTVSHLVSVAAGEISEPDTLRRRVARLLERISGPAPGA